MPTIESVQAIVSNPSEREPQGRTTLGYYILKDDVLTMTDSKGAPARNHKGDKYEQKVEENDNVTLIAQRLTMKIHLSRLGSDTGFNRPMNLNNFTSW